MHIMGEHTVNKHNLSVLFTGVVILIGSLFLGGSVVAGDFVSPVCVYNLSIALVDFEFSPDPHGDFIVHSGPISYGVKKKIVDDRMREDLWLRVESTLDEPTASPSDREWRFAPNIDGRFQVGKQIKAGDTIVLSGDAYGGVFAHAYHNMGCH